MKNLYYRQFGLQLFVGFIKAWILSFLIVLITYCIFTIFSPILKKGIKSSSTPLRTATEFVIFTTAGCLASMVLVYKSGNRRENDPFRYAPFAEQYFSLTGVEAQKFLARLKGLGFTLDSSSLDSGLVRGYSIQEFEAPEPPHSGLTRLKRRVLVEARLADGIWEGRIHSTPSNWIVFHDGANISRVSLKTIADQLGLTLQTDLPTKLR